MTRWFLMGKLRTGSRAETKDFFGFRSHDVVGLHRRKYDETHIDLYFRLRDGRVIDGFGCRHNPDPLLYDQSH
jgi:hypothetical protein